MNLGGLQPPLFEYNRYINKITENYTMTKSKEDLQKEVASRLADELMSKLFK